MQGAHVPSENSLDGFSATASGQTGQSQTHQSQGSRFRHRAGWDDGGSEAIYVNITCVTAVGAVGSQQTQGKVITHEGGPACTGGRQVDVLKLPPATKPTIAQINECTGSGGGTVGAGQDVNALAVVVQ